MIPPFEWWRGALAYVVVTSWLGLLPKGLFWLLPWVGDYAYWNDPWVRWCRNNEYRAPQVGLPESF